MVSFAIMAALVKTEFTMHVQINVDHEDLTNPGRFQAIRSAAYFLLHSIGDIKDEDAETPPTGATATAGNVPPPLAIVPSGTNVPPPPPSEPVFRPPGATVTTSPDGAHTITTVPPPPPPPPTVAANGDDESEGASNVVQGNFPQAGAVPPPPSAHADTAATNVPTAPSASNAAGATNVVSAEVDSAGMQYDARIHQKAQGKKKDGTWKLIKGVDTAIVQAVTAELAARKGASAPVSLPPAAAATGSTSVPVPPVANVPAPPGVPAPPAGGASSSVPVPPSPTAGTVGASAYRTLIDKITELTRANKITPAKVSEICQSQGAPSLMALNSMQHLIAAVESSIDAAALGLL